MPGYISEATCRGCKRTYKGVDVFHKPDGKAFWFCEPCNTDNYSEAFDKLPPSRENLGSADGGYTGGDDEDPPPVAEWKERAAGMKHDTDKLRLDLLHPIFVEDVARVLTYGARKYAPDNWRKVRHARRRYRGALQRHLLAHLKGEANDPESGLPHLAHAGCCLMFLHALDVERVKDDPEPCGLEPCEVCYPGGKKEATVQPKLAGSTAYLHLENKEWPVGSKAYLHSLAHDEWCYACNKTGCEKAR